MSENSGGDVNYYRVEVAHPKRAEPYVAECEDIIAALGMDFFEGEAFKAAWRKAAQRTLGIGKAGNTALRDAEKMAHYGACCLAIEQHRRTADLLLEESEVTVGPGLPPAQWIRGDQVTYLGGLVGDAWGVGRTYTVLSGSVSALRISNDSRVAAWVPFERLDGCFRWVRRP